jgi:hypothetical protein
MKPRSIFVFSTLYIFLSTDIPNPNLRPLAIAIIHNTSIIDITNGPKS